MIKEDKELLLKDLCARLPYGVVYHRNDSANIKLNAIDVKRGLLNYTDDIEKRECKPYLRSISSITEGEKKEYDSFLFDNLEKEDVIGYEDKVFGADVIMRYRSWEVVQWLLEHHLDFYGLIDLGLALEAPEGMYEY